MLADHPHVSEVTTSESALAGLVARLADNKLFLGRRYAEWCTAAPALEAAVAAAAMAQDEVGHARSLFPLLQDMAGVSTETVPETRVNFVNATFLGQPFESWTDFVAANLLFDTALSVLLEAAKDSSSGGLAQRARRILEEERLHWLQAQGETRRLAGKGQAVCDALNKSFARILPEALSFLDAADDGLVTQAILSSGAAELRIVYRDRVNAVLSAANLPLI
jgi:ring-1,2-phenylacetyl-CoA epoxidase subunit PaaC